MDDRELQTSREILNLYKEREKLEGKKRTPGEKARLGTVKHTLNVILRNKARENIELALSRGDKPSELELEQAEYHGYPTPEGGRKRRRRKTRRRKNRRR